MANELHQVMGGCLAAAGPLALLGFGLIPASLLNRQPLRTARIGALLSLVAFVFALAAVGTRLWRGTVDVSFSLAGPIRLGVHLDNLSSIVLLLVAFLLAVVTRYSVNYLSGDPGQGRFSKWLCLDRKSVV